MFGIRQKLLFGFGGLLAVLLIVSGLGIAVLRQHRSELERFLSENWRSIEYGQEMARASAQLDDLAKPFADAANVTADRLADMRSHAADPLKRFADNLELENHNITLDGEDAIAKRLNRLWSGEELTIRNGVITQRTKLPGENYLDSLQTLLSPTSDTAARVSAYAAVRRLFPQLNANAQQVIDLNFANMTPLAGRAKSLADRATHLMVLLGSAGVILAILFTLVMSRTILRPLTTLTSSFREIEQGNLDLVVHVKSHDELHQLAEAFNSMAAKLREFRRSDQAKLYRTQRTTQLAVNSLTDAIAIINQEGSVELSNEAACKLFGLVPGRRLEEVPERHLNDIYHEVVAKQRPSPPRGYESAIAIYDDGGQLKHYLPHAVPIIEGPEKRLVGVTLVLGDVTNLRRLDEMKSGLLSVVSHELKNPLTSIRMAAHVLLEERVGGLNEKQVELLNAAREDADRLNQIIENLLDMGRMETGRGLIELKAVEAEVLVRDAIDDVAASYREKGVALATDDCAGIVPVLADPERVRHIFSNLLTNALKYTAPGGSVKVSAGMDESIVRFTVEDSGAGIAPDVLPRVFERFYRAPDQPGRSGVGLGLAIAREIVQVHGGTITAQSEPGKGSRFTFTLRRADAGGEST